MQVQNGNNDIFHEEMSDEELAQLQLQLASDLKERFQRNIEAFENFMPDVATSFKNYRPKETMQFFCTSNGVPNVEFPHLNHKILYPCDNPLEVIEQEVDHDLKDVLYTCITMKKQYDPYGQIHFRYVTDAYTDALKSVDTQNGINDGNLKNVSFYTPDEIKSIPHCLVLGPGLAYCLGLLYSKVAIANMVVVEPEPDLFFASLHAFDWASLLEYIKNEKLGFNLIVGQSPNEFFTYMNNFFLHHGAFLATNTWTYVGRSDQTILECAKIIKRDYYSVYSQMGFFDDHLFAVSHALDTALKGRHFVKRKAQLPPKMRAWPVFIVGNGPSLDHDIPFLRKNQDKAVIIACGTALDTLYHAGIKPDFYAATERTPEISETIKAIPDKEFIDSLTLIAGDVIHPKTVACFKHTAIFGKPDEPFYWFWQTQVDSKYYLHEIDLMNPVVGNLGVASIFGFGFNEAYLFGLDCGRRKESMHSAFSTVYHEAGVNDKGGVYSSSSNDDTLAGNFGGEVISTYYLKSACKNMSYVLHHHYYYEDEIFKVYNCSDGALIDGTIPKHSEDLNFDGRPILDKQKLMDYVENDFTFAPKITPELCDQFCSKPIFKEISSRLRKFIKDVPSTRVEAVQRMMSVSEFCFDIAHARGTSALGYFFHGSIQAFFMNALFVLYHCQDEKKALTGYDKVIQNMYNFLDDADKLFSFIPHYILGEHYHFCNNKIGFDHGERKAPPAPAYPKLFKKKFDDPVKKFVKRYK